MAAHCKTLIIGGIPHRKCLGCGVVVPLSKWRTFREKNADGSTAIRYRSRCRECEREQARGYERSFRHSALPPKPFDGQALPPIKAKDALALAERFGKREAERREKQRERRQREKTAEYCDTAAVALEIYDIRMRMAKATGAI